MPEIQQLVLPYPLCHYPQPMDLVTQYEPLIVENGFLIKVGSYAYKIQCFNAENLRILKEVHTNHQGIKEDVC